MDQKKLPRRIVRWLVRAMGYTLLGLTALVALALATINVPALSNWVAHEVTSVLEPSFKGRLVLHRLGHIDFGGVTGAEIEVFDPAGNSVLGARNVDVRASLLRLVWNLVTGDSNTTSLAIDQIAIEHVRVGLVDDGTGAPTLAQAFEPREPEPEPSEAASTIIALSEIRVQQVEVRGALASPGPIDADLRELRASLESRPDRLQLVLESVEVEARQLPTVDHLKGRLTADVTLPTSTASTAVPSDAPRAAQGGPQVSTYALRPEPISRRVAASFKGELAGSGLTADMHMVGEQLRALVDAPALTPATVMQVAPGLTPRTPLALAAHVEGALSDLGFDARVTQEAALITARGRVQIADASSKIQAHLDFARVNLAALLAEAVESELNLGANTRLTFGSEGGKGQYEVTTRPSRVATERIPETRVRGELSLPSHAPVVSTGTLNIDEPGAITLIEYHVEAGDAGTRARIESRTDLRRAPRVKALSGGLTAVGQLRTKASFDTASEQLSATFDLNLTDVQHPAVAVRKLYVGGTVRGKLDAPELDLNAKLHGATASGRSFSLVNASARGTPERLAISATAMGTHPDHITLTGTLINGPELALLAPVVRVMDAKGNLRAKAKRIAFPTGKVEVDELTLEGPGRAELSLRYGPSLEHLSLRTTQLNAAKILDIAGVQSELKDARITLDAEYSQRRSASRGKLDLELSDVDFGKLKGARSRANLRFEGGKVTGGAEIELARGAKTLITVKDVKTPGGAPGAGIESVTGDVSLAGELDLKQLQGLLPLTNLERAEGTVRFDIDLQRKPGSATPTLHAHIETQKLVLVELRPDTSRQANAEQAKNSSPRWLRGIDINLDATLEKDRASVQGKLFDKEGDVIRAEAEWKQLSGLGNPALLGKSFMRAPFTARAEVPERAFDKFPAPIRPTEIAGLFSLGVEAEGRLVDPRVRARARVKRFGPASEVAGAPRLDLELAADYASRGGSVRVDAHDGLRSLLDVDSRWVGDALLLASQAGGKSPVSADVHVVLDQFPIDVIPALQNRRVRGKVSGDVRLDQFGRDARFTLDLTTDELRVDRLRIDQFKALARTEQGQLVLTSSIAGASGSIQAELTTGVDWGDRVIPTLDEQLVGSLRAKDFRLGALQPLVEGSLSELDGKLDADLRAVMAGGSPRVSGRAQLREGVVHLPSVGQRFQDMTASLQISPEAIILENFRARGTSGGFEADARAELDELTPTSASLNVRIKEDDKLPLTVEGEAVGDGWGKISARYEHDEAQKKNTLRVNLDEFNIELPQAPPQGIQDLGQPDHIRVGFHRNDRDFVAIPLQPLEEPGAPSEYETVIVVELGSVHVEKGQQAEVALGGQVQATLGEELDVRGKIETRSGELDISGKKFEIERGSVTFNGGKPDDPTISAVARYDSPTGFTVYAEYTGTVTQGKLRLSSEPPLSQDEILTLLLFGTPDGSVGAGSGDSFATAVSVAGSTATQGLNRALSDVTDLDVSARIDTSTGAPRPELVLQLTPRVAARVTQALGEPTPGQSPDRTFLTIELRLASAWSLSTMIGDRGASALDLIWRKRY